MTMQSGYAITIRGFVPVDRHDLAAHRKALEAIDAAAMTPKGAEGAAPDALFKIMTVESFDVKPVQRKG